MASATTSRSPPPRCFSYRASPENQLNQEGCPHTGRGSADGHGHELARPTLDIDEGKREQQEVEQEVDRHNDEDERPQQQVNDIAAAVTAEIVGNTYLSGENRSPRSAERQQSPPNRDLPPEPSQDGGSDGHSGDDLNNTDSSDNDEKLRPMKQKWPSVSYDGLVPKSVSIIFSRGLPSNIDHSPSLINALSNHG
jgi:hypothetical protein